MNKVGSIYSAYQADPWLLSPLSGFSPEEVAEREERRGGNSTMVTGYPEHGFASVEE